LGRRGHKVKRAITQEEDDETQQNLNLLDLTCEIEDKESPTLMSEIPSSPPITPTQVVSHSPDDDTSLDDDVSPTQPYVDEVELSDSQVTDADIVAVMELDTSEYDNFLLKCIARQDERSKQMRLKQLLEKHILEFYQHITTRTITRSENKEMQVAALVHQQSERTKNLMKQMSPVARVMIYEKLLASPIYVHSMHPLHKTYYLSDIPPLTDDLMQKMCANAPQIPHCLWWGKTLHDLWPTLFEALNTDILSIIRDVLDELNA